MENNKMYKMEENEMSDISTESLLLARGVGGYGYGGVWGGGYGGYGPFASPESNAVRINRNADFTKLALDRISDQNEETRRNLGEARVMSNITEGHNRICDRLVDGEFRTNDRLRDLEREMQANAREAAKCCCDLKVQAANDKAEILSTMQALSKEGIARDLDRAERQIIALQTQIACGCTTGCTKPCS